MNEDAPELVNEDNVTDAECKTVDPRTFVDTGVAIDTLKADASQLTEQVKPGRRRWKRRRTNWMLVTLFLSLFVAYVFYVLVLPQIEVSVFRSFYPQKKILPPELEMKWAHRILLRSCEFALVAWFFYFGASIGSFLNVVAWRVPAGRTIVFGGSKCPFCDTHLGFIDNTPILGWLCLQGKCRTCRLPIATRYLWIEVAVGAAFTWLALWQLVRGGANLPHWTSQARVGLINIVLDPHWPMIGIYLIHAILFAMLIMLATANMSNKPFPVFPIVLIGFGLASSKIIDPSLDLVSWQKPFSKLGLTGYGPFANPAMSVVVGGLAGGLLGWISAFAYARKLGAAVGRHWALQCFLIAVVLGWQSGVIIVMLSLIAYSVVRTLVLSIRPRRSDEIQANQSLMLNICFILSAVAHHSFWIQIAHLLGLS